ncbi:pullulanase [Alkalihalophilus pseudofirmus]|nr:pullulanase [Alkalihalophilus pseudofirmus]
MEITGHTVEKLADTTGILVGDRYEFTLNVVVSEDDELHNENGIYLRVIYAYHENDGRVVQYQIHEKTTNEHIDFALEEEEVEIINNYCRQQVEAPLK